jgi:HEAT repeat protein
VLPLTAVRCFFHFREECIVTLIEMLANPDPSVRIEAAEELAGLGSAAKDAVPALMTMLDDSDVNARAAAAIALGCIGPDAKEAVGKLDALLEDSRELVRWVAVIGLGGIGPEASSAVPSIIRRLRDEAENVSWGAMLALGHIGPETAPTVPALVELLSDQKDDTVWGAAKALGEMGEAAVLPLIEGLKSDRHMVRHACTTALARIGSAAQAAVPALIAALSGTGEELEDDVRRPAALALGQIGPAAVSAIPALIEALRQSPSRMQFTVAKAVKDIGPEHAIAALIPLLADEKAGWGALYVLHEIGAAAVPELIAVLNSGDRLTRFHAYLTFRTIGLIGVQAQSAVPVLIRFLRDDDSTVRREAVKALDRIQGR